MKVKIKVKVKPLSRVRLLVIPWTAAYQAPPPMGFSRQEYWSAIAFSNMVPYKDINIIQDIYIINIYKYLQVNVIFIKDYIEAKE